MTGINSPYEPPEAPDFIAAAGQKTLEALVAELLPIILAATEGEASEDPN
jgi:adenylylsulfate kinase-like enzyme